MTSGTITGAGAVRERSHHPHSQQAHSLVSATLSNYYSRDRDQIL